MLAKKNTSSNNQNNQIVTCTTPASAIVYDDSVFHISNDTAYLTLNNTFYSEHKISADKGCGMEYGITHIPNSGTYQITRDYSQIKIDSQKVFIQYFLNGSTYTAQSGTLSVTGTGVGATIEICKILFINNTNDSLTVSLKSDFQ
ncbi:MAG: hypothetical protein UZ11_BCD004001946 [Bacteroidetes bacterium OLB11]|nr:MAG: hypothetical protein UZ11_BCD004001946 [Bacteroidetes bacterium OLB11]